MKLDIISEKLLKKLIDAKANGVYLSHLENLDFFKGEGKYPNYQRHEIVEVFKHLEKHGFLTIDKSQGTAYHEPDSIIGYTLHHKARAYFE